MALGRRAALLFAACAVLSQGCTETLLERAIRARGGRLESLEREVDARVHFGFAGEWSWEMAYRRPELFRWTIHTYGEEQSYVYDGRSAALFLGSAMLPVEPAALASFRSQARWIAVTALDVLASDRLAWEELAPAELPPGIARGLRARFLDDGATYLLYLDGRDLLVAADGPILLPPIGAGQLHADFEDFRAVDGYRLPFLVRYALDGRALVDESVRRWVPNDPELTEASFATGKP